jgi:hypothetical protein
VFWTALGCTLFCPAVLTVFHYNKERDECDSAIRKIFSDMFDTAHLELNTRNAPRDYADNATCFVSYVVSFV